MISAAAARAAAWCGGRGARAYAGKANHRGLTAKKGPRGYYKGKGQTPPGRHTKKGGYVLQKAKLPEYVVPDLEGFALKPYVSRQTPKVAAPKEG